MAAIDFPENTICLSSEFTETRVPSYMPENNKLNSDRRGTTTRQLAKFTGLILPQRTKAQVAAFIDVFHDVTLNKGQEPFNVPHPRTGAIIEAQFVSPPVSVKTGTRYRIEFDIVEI